MSDNDWKLATEARLAALRLEFSWCGVRKAKLLRERILELESLAQECTPVSTQPAAAPPTH